jgi:hypothetical protein
VIIFVFSWSCAKIIIKILTLPTTLTLDTSNTLQTIPLLSCIQPEVTDVPQKYIASGEWWFRSKEQIENSKEMHKSVIKMFVAKEQQQHLCNRFKNKNVTVTEDSSSISSSLFDSTDSDDSECEKMERAGKSKKMHKGLVEVLSSKQFKETGTIQKHISMVESAPLKNVTATGYFFTRSPKNEMINEPIACDYEKASTIYLSFFAFISVYLHRGDIFFNFVKKGHLFVLSFLEWSFLYLNRMKIMIALSNREALTIMNPLRLTMHPLLWNSMLNFHTLVALHLSKKGKLTFVVERTTAWKSGGCHNEGQELSDNKSFRLNKNEVELLLTQHNHPFIMYVNLLQESRLSLNITMAAVCNLLLAAKNVNTKALGGRLMDSWEIIRQLTNLFAPFNYHTHVRLRAEIDRIYHTIPISARRTLPMYTTLSDCLHILFPSQMNYLLELYSTAKKSSERIYFRCDYCISMNCVGKVGTSEPLCKNFIY